MDIKRRRINMKNISNLNQFTDHRQNGDTYEPLGIAHICEPGYHQVTPHWHPHYEILLILRGEYTIKNGKTIVSDTVPRALVHFPYSLHDCHAQASSPYDRYMITFTRKFLHTFIPKLFDSDALQHTSFICTTPSDEEMDALISLARQIQQNLHDPVLCELLTAAILRKIIQGCEAGRGEIVSGEYSYIQEALGYMATNLSTPLTAEEMAEKLDVSKTTFNRAFRATLGKTYKQHLTDLRQTFARDMLRHGTSIINASIDTGYSSEAHFIKAFREYWGITPGEFIRKTQDSG